MNPKTIHSVGPSDEDDKDTALAEFFSSVKTAARESEAAVAEAKPALARITGIRYSKRHSLGCRRQ